MMNEKNKIIKIASVLLFFLSIFHPISVSANSDMDLVTTMPMSEEQRVKQVELKRKQEEAKKFKQWTSDKANWDKEKEKIRRKYLKKLEKEKGIQGKIDKFKKQIKKWMDKLMKKISKSKNSGSGENYVE